jgi:CheY-like chemotaxis protein
MSKILVAEDNAANRELFRELLEARGHEVVEACDGQVALQILEQNEPDILLLDIGMPVLDGFAVIRAVRANPRLATLPVLGVTAYAMQGDRERILASGFDGYLSKPIDAELLAGEVERLSSRRALQKPDSRQTDTESVSRKASARDIK